MKKKKNIVTGVISVLIVFCLVIAGMPAAKAQTADVISSQESSGTSDNELSENILSSSASSEIEAEDNVASESLEPEESEDNISSIAPSSTLQEAEVKISADMDITDTWGDVNWVLDDSGTLTFTAVSPTNNTFKETDTATKANFISYSSSITKIVFEDDIKLNAKSGFLFADLNNLKTIEGLNNVDTSNATTMESMFANCSKLEGLDLGDNFDTSNVTDMSSMFLECSSLTSLDLKDKFDTSKVKRMNSMFYGCGNLTSLDLGDLFNTSEATTMGFMFNKCSSLASLDLKDKFDTSKVTNMQSMFQSCSSLTSLDLKDKFNTSKVITVSGMFNGCSSLTTLDLKDSFNTSNVTNMGSMFNGCSSLTSLDLGDNFTTSKATTMGSMLNNCTNLESITLCADFRFLANANLKDNTAKFGKEWVGQNSPSVIFLDSDTFMANYAGQANTYKRIKAAPYNITYAGAFDSTTGDYIGNLDTNSNSSTYISGTGIPTLSAPTKTGYTFQNWYDDSALTSPIAGISTLRSGNITLYATFSANPYDVTFDDQGTTTKQSVPFKQLVTKPAATPSKTGNTFAGWAKADGTLWDFATDTMPASDITLTATFTVNSYNVTFDNQGTTTIQSFPFGQLVTQPTASPTKTGYSFTGWAKSDGTLWDFTTDTMPANDITLTAMFSVNSYNLTFDNQGTTTTQSVPFEQLATKPTDPSAKAHYTFTGWAKADGTLWDFATDTMPASDITLTAVFSADLFDVTFDNEGTTTTQGVPFEQLVTKPTDPTKTGCTFIGWEKADGTFWDFATETMPASNITLTAVFSPKIYTVTFLTYDLKEIRSYTAKYGDIIMSKTGPAVAGHVFAGWVIEGTDTKWSAGSVMPADDLVLVATYDKYVGTDTSGANASGANATKDKNASPKTGDSTQLTPVLIVFSVSIVSLAVLVFFVIKKKVKENSNN